MNLLVGVNAAYLGPLSVMLYSLAVHNPVSIKLYILHFGIERHVQKQFKKKVAGWKKKIEILFLKADSAFFTGMVNPERFKMEANLRLLLLKALPDDVDRILWLDTDVIVRGSLKELYFYPDQGQYAVVCEDMCPKWEKNTIISRIGMKWGERYFNSGVMVFYLKNLRKCFGENDFLQWMYDNPDKLQYPDQNTLNVCLKDGLCWVKPELYNLQMLRISRRIRESGLMDKSKIFHYNTREKPWDEIYEGEGEKEFWKYGIRALGVGKYISHYITKYKRIMGRLLSDMRTVV